MTKIETRPCGNSSLSLPVLGIGCWSFGGGDYWGPQDQKDVDAVVSLALERGANYFDTAEAYNEGRSEESLGLALRGRRSQAILGAKIPPNAVQPEALRLHCEASLRRLQTDVIDLYMVHWPIPTPAVEGAFTTLQALQSEGKIRTIGVSNFGAQQLDEALRTGARIVANQLYYNLLSRALEFELIPYCARRGLGILAYMPLQQGLLTGKYASADEMPSVRTRTRHFRPDRPGSRHGEPGAEEETFAALRGLREIAAGLDASMSQVALSWILSRPEITCIVAGIRSIEQLEANLAGIEVKLAPGVVDRLDSLTQPLRDTLGPSPDYFQATRDSRTF